MNRQLQKVLCYKKVKQSKSNNRKEKQETRHKGMLIKLMKLNQSQLLSIFSISIYFYVFGIRSNDFSLCITTN